MKPSVTPKLPAWLHHPDLQAVCRHIAAAGGEARFVGGVVRDMVRGVGNERMPPDIDMACTLLPQDTTQCLQSAGYRVIPTGIAHGTITVILPRIHLEITTLRRDTSCDGRHAQVIFGTDFAEDANRRDFTMNALYVSMDGTLYDFHGGKEDARYGRVKFIGDADARITQDALRILRFYRFHAQLGAAIDAHGHAACARLSAAVFQLSGERIAQEMKKLLSAPAPEPALTAMQEAGILSNIALPVAPIPTFGVAVDDGVRLSCLLPNVDAVKTLCARWKLSNADKERLLYLVREPLSADDAIHVHQQHIYRAGYAAYRGLAQRSAVLQHAPCIGEVAERLRDWSVPIFPIKSLDVRALGLEGKALGEALKRLENQWLANGFSDTKETLLTSLKAYSSSSAASSLT